MNPILAGVALAVVAGSVAAVSVRDARATILAVSLVLVVSPLVADPLAEPAGLAARLIGALLAGYLLWVSARPSAAGGSAGLETEGSRIGWPAEALVAASAAIVGFAAHGLGAPAGGPALASAAGYAVAAVATIPLLTGRDVLRVGVGCLLLTDAALLVRTGLGGTAAPSEQLLSAALVAALGGAIAVTAMVARADGSGDLELDSEPRPRRRRVPDAHRIDTRRGRTTAVVPPDAV